MLLGGDGEGIKCRTDPQRGRAERASAPRGVQLLGGLLNLLLLAPVWMQIVHLLVADLLWIAFVLLGARTLAGEPARAMGRMTTP